MIVRIRVVAGQWVLGSTDC